MSDQDETAYESLLRLNKVAAAEKARDYLMEIVWNHDNHEVVEVCKKTIIVLCKEFKITSLCSDVSVERVEMKRNI